jgi:hypothetical protein
MTHERTVDVQGLLSLRPCLVRARCKARLRYGVQLLPVPSRRSLVAWRVGLQPAHHRRDRLTLYQFNTMTARHYRCRHCGIHTFSRPRLDPSRWAVNVRCIDAVDPSLLPLRRFDGENWEQAAEALRAQRK